MKFISSTVARKSLSGKTYSSFCVAKAPADDFSVVPFLLAAFGAEDTVDIEHSEPSPEPTADAAHRAPSPSPVGLAGVTTPKRNLSDAGLDDENPSSKRHAAPSPSIHSDGLNPLPDTMASDASAPPKAPVRKARDKARFGTYRKNTRVNATVASGQEPKATNVKQHVPGSSSTTPLPQAIDFDALPVSSSGYEALTKGSTGPNDARTLAEVLATGKRHVAWDGITPLLFTDPKTDTIGMAAVGRPDDPFYVLSIKHACEKILEAGRNAKFTSAQRDHKRGREFGALNVGVLAGHGPKQPYNLLNGVHEPMLAELLADEDITRVATFQSATFRIFMPKLFKRYHALRQDVERHMPHLQWNFKKSVFSAAAFNFGPQTVTARHRDCMNLPGGFCAITAMGEFNSKQGGHLVVEELGIVIEFPAGSTILLPSAVFTHSNTAIQPGETRVSFTQFSSGALFRYADNGYRTEEELKAYNIDLYNDMIHRKSKRWESTLELWSTLADVLKYAKLKLTETGSVVDSDDFEDADCGQA